MIKQFRSLLAISLLAGAACFFLFSGTSSAATIDVVAGTDENTDNGSCALTEAIENINDGAQTNTDCVETGAYGTDDTINLPTGTITLSADLPQITESLTIAGQGMGESIIDGDGAYAAIDFLPDSTSQLSVNGLTITGFVRAGIFVQSLDSDLTVKQVEVDGTNAVDDGVVPFIGGVLVNVTGEVYLMDVFIHDINILDEINAVGIGLFGGGDSSGSAVISNATITAITSPRGSTGISINTGVIDGSYSAATVDLELINSTISNLISSDGEAIAVNVFGAISGGETNVSITATNNTFRNLSGIADLANNGTIRLVAAAAGDNDVYTANYVSKNNIYAEGSSDGVPNTCGIVNLNPLLPGTGTVNLNISSSGGNLTDDNTCSSYFTHPTDQNNVAGLAASLSPLADNGGYVPTMALLEGSPAVDAGVTVAGLTTDARLAARPQGNAYDSGAYESPYTKPDPLADDGEGLAESGQHMVVIAVASLLMTTLGLVSLLAQKQTKLI